MNFTVEEINFICIALGDTKEETIDNIFDMMPDIDDKDMRDIGEKVLGKLDLISEDEFQMYDFGSNFAE